MSQATVIEVDARNFDYEYHKFIEAAQMRSGGTVVVDTEFPGNIYSSAKPYHSQTPEERYAMLKANVDDLRPIQVGISLCYTENIHEHYIMTWQFNLNDFDINLHPYSKDSIALLESAGISMDHIRHFGIPSVWLAQLLLDSGLLCSGEYDWVVFQGSYDFGILLKAILQLSIGPYADAVLPPTLEEFMALTNYVFGPIIYDIKCLMSYCGIHGGLERLAEDLKVKRLAGKAHQAGSDSLVTFCVFYELCQLYDIFVFPCEGALSGLHICGCCH